MSQVTLVVGAGAIGLLTSYKLAKAGLNVILLEAGATGQESSWAGGGIVSPLYPWRYSPAVTALAHWSQAFYPSFGEQLHQESGIDPEVHATGLYWLDLEDETDALSWAQALNRPLSSVSIDSVEAAVPSLRKNYFQHALYMPGVANIRNPRLLQSLRAALLKLPNVQLREQCPVTGFIHENHRITGVETAQGKVFSERVILAAGAWSGQLLATLGLKIPVKPMKGQMILFKCAADFLPVMVMTKERYAIPRRDGHILIGSTLEDVGFDKTTTSEAQTSLLNSAVELLPELANAQIIKHWAGLRPGSPEGIPYIGPVPEYEGLWLNCGHFRNGLVLAPASCQLLTELVLQQPTSIDPSPYTTAGRIEFC
ncbi:glycine oxidase [Azomonas agilis]|uniref:Glycine oxidase n=1 Tax=Azomonas agilis TaxID=116849 RepID=A0A562I043_9GAMM|nr:glycine oxidase ThiO [Azomonas agilis]TWH64429.1 glycine oxidase [Azomonas agilis]